LWKQSPLHSVSHGYCFPMSDTILAHWIALCQNLPLDHSSNLRFVSRDPPSWIELPEWCLKTVDYCEMLISTQTNSMIVTTFSHLQSSTASFEAEIRLTVWNCIDSQVETHYRYFNSRKELSDRSKFLNHPTFTILFKWRNLQWLSVKRIEYVRAFRIS